MLVAMFAERESHAAYFLQEQEMTRYDAVNFISHGVAKKPGHSESRPVVGENMLEMTPTLPPAKRWPLIASTSMKSPRRTRGPAYRARQ